MTTGHCPQLYADEVYDDVLGEAPTRSLGGVTSLSYSPRDQLLLTGYGVRALGVTGAIADQKQVPLLPCEYPYFSPPQLTRPAASSRRPAPLMAPRNYGIWRLARS